VFCTARLLALLVSSSHHLNYRLLGETGGENRRAYVWDGEEDGIARPGDPSALSVAYDVASCRSVR